MNVLADKVNEVGENGIFFRLDFPSASAIMPELVEVQVFVCRSGKYDNVV